VQLWVRLRAPIWHVGASWAALGGALAGGLLARGNLLHPEQDGALPRVAILLLTWLLADPLLGTLWELGATPQGIWVQLWRPVHTPEGVPLILMPYTRPGSSAWWIAEWLGRQLAWWRADFWPQSGESFITVCSLLLAALTVGAILGSTVLVLVCGVIVLAWLTALWQKGKVPRSSLRMTIAGAWAQFGIPWMIGCAAAGSGQTHWLAVALGACLTISYVGLLRCPASQLIVLAGQLGVLILVIGVRHLLATTVIAVLLAAQLGLLLAKGPSTDSTEAPYAEIHPFIVSVIVIAAFGVGFS